MFDRYDPRDDDGRSRGEERDRGSRGDGVRAEARDDDSRASSVAGVAVAGQGVLAAQRQNHPAAA